MVIKIKLKGLNSIPLSTLLVQSRHKNHAQSQQ